MKLDWEFGVEGLYSHWALIARETARGVRSIRFFLLGIGVGLHGMLGLWDGIWMCIAAQLLVHT
jgi:hypothetical protein